MTVSPPRRERRAEWICAAGTWVTNVPPARETGLTPRGLVPKAWTGKADVDPHRLRVRVEQLVTLSPPSQGVIRADSVSRAPSAVVTLSPPP